MGLLAKGATEISRKNGRKFNQDTRRRSDSCMRAPLRFGGRGGAIVSERRLLDTTDLFAAMPDDVLESLRDQSTLRTLERNEVLFRQGDPSSELYVVQDGRVAIAQQSGDGRESVGAVLETGGLFGEVAL